jgi:hypothetical protein
MLFSSSIIIIFQLFLLSSISIIILQFYIAMVTLISLIISVSEKRFNFCPEKITFCPTYFSSFPTLVPHVLVTYISNFMWDTLV